MPSLRPPEFGIISGQEGDVMLNNQQSDFTDDDWILNALISTLQGDSRLRIRALISPVDPLSRDFTQGQHRKRLNGTKRDEFLGNQSLIHRILTVWSD